MLVSHEPLEPSSLVRSTWSPDQFPDRRLFKRLEITAKRVLELLSSSGDGAGVNVRRAERRGAQRLYHNDRIDVDMLEQSAEAKMTAALASEKLVVLAHDTTEVDVHGRDEPDDAGPLRSSNARGYLVHLCAAVGATGALLGIVCCFAWTRTWDLKKQNHAKREPSDKESIKWLTGIERAAKQLGTVVGRILVHVMDREGDFYDNFVFALALAHIVVTRAARDHRIVEGRGFLWAHMQSQPATRLAPIQIRDEKAREVGASNPLRKVDLTIRWARVTLKPPTKKKLPPDAKPVQVYAVYVREEHPPKHGKRVEWMLLTTYPVETAEAAVQVLTWYRQRWGVEDVIKILKTAGRIEKDRVDNIDSFRRMLAIVVPMATHVARWTHAARVTPMEPASAHVEPETIQALKAACRFHKLPLPRRPWTIGDVVTRLAQIGGHEIRPDAVPGPFVIWRGFRNLQQFWRTFQYSQTLVKQGLE